MSDYLMRYIPEFDEAAIRQKLAAYGSEDLTHMLITAYKEKRVLAKMINELSSKQERIKVIVDEASTLASMPDVPGPDDLRKMFE
jgi:hypothetical protein